MGEQRRQRKQKENIDFDKFREVSVSYTRNESDRAIKRGRIYAREQRKQEVKDNKKEKQQQRQLKTNNSNTSRRFLLPRRSISCQQQKRRGQLQQLTLRRPSL